MASADTREALYNDQPTGLAGQIQLPLERITTLHGFIMDMDPDILDDDNPHFPPDRDPRAFFAGMVSRLERDPLARHAEGRASGRGLHLIVRLSPPVQLNSAGDQSYWDHIVRAVQATLPSDVSAPGITVLTRPIGSLNSKNGAIV